MTRRDKTLVFMLAVLATAVASVSLAWACLAPDTGIPPSGSAPSASPPNPGGTTDGAAAGAPAGTGAPTAAAPAAPADGSVATGTTSGATPSKSAPSRSRQPAPSIGDTSVGRSARAPSVASRFAARVEGRTEGLTRQGRQPVFASSVERGRSAVRAASKKGAEASERSAVSDAWGAFDPSGRPLSSVSDAQAFSPAEGSKSGLGAVGVGVLALGLLGVLSTALVASTSRRRAMSVSK